MRNFNLKIKLDDGKLINYKTTTSVDTTVTEMTSTLSEATKYLILKQPNGSETLINARHIVYINVAEDTDPA